MLNNYTKMWENIIPKWIISDMEIGSWVREWQTQVTEQDIQRVQVQSWQAKQVFAQIQKDKKQNNQMADFLTFLLKTIKNEKIISGIHNVFFKVKHTNQEIAYMRKSINTIVVVWIFAPFYPTEIRHFWLNGFFEKIYNFQNPLSLSNYLSYLKNYHKITTTIYLSTKMIYLIL